jgi:hypothetical protein
MDRHNRVLAGGCAALMAALIMNVAGCRSMRNDVPPGKPYSTTGGSPPPVGFNSDPHPNTSVGAGLYGNPMNGGSTSPDAGPVGAGSTTQFGTPPPAGSPYGVPTTGRYGSPTTTTGPTP